MMENLHLSYDEVVNQIPFKTLMIMQTDKMHVIYGDVVKKVSGKSMGARRMAGRPKQNNVEQEKTE